MAAVELIGSRRMVYCFCMRTPHIITIRTMWEMFGLDNDAWIFGVAATREWQWKSIHRSNILLKCGASWEFSLDYESNDYANGRCRHENRYSIYLARNMMNRYNYKWPKLINVDKITNVSIQYAEEFFFWYVIGSHGRIRTLSVCGTQYLITLIKEYC